MSEQTSTDRAVLQAFYDKTIAHLVQQGKQATVLSALDGRPICVYRTKDCAMCAIGVHIPEDVYTPKMENRGVISLLMDFPELRAYIPNEDLAVELQRLHDRDYYWGKGGLNKEGRAYAAEAARRWYLTPFAFELTR